MPRTRTLKTKDETEMIRRQNAEMKRLLDELEAQVAKEGVSGGEDPKTVWRKLVGISLPETTVYRLEDRMADLQHAVSGRVSRSGVVDYLIRKAPEINPSEFVADSSARWHGRGIPRHYMRNVGGGSR